MWLVQVRGSVQVNGILCRRPTQAHRIPSLHPAACPDVGHQVIRISLVLEEEEEEEEKKGERRNHPPAAAGAVRPGRCWLRARCRCAASTMLTIYTGYA
jgi:hypothetical protein